MQVRNLGIPDDNLTSGHGCERDETPHLNMVADDAPMPASQTVNRIYGEHIASLLDHPRLDEGLQARREFAVVLDELQTDLPGDEAFSAERVRRKIEPAVDAFVRGLRARFQDRLFERLDGLLARARLAVEHTTLTGMASTLSLHRELLAEPWLQQADFHTGTLETWLAARRAGGVA